jgi:hypothetical protein
MIFGKVKEWLGIEGVKMEIILSQETFDKKQATIQGQIKFTTLRPQQITNIHIRVLERYTRGRGSQKKTNEYELGNIIQSSGWQVLPHEPCFVEFTLPFNTLQSEMDDLHEKGGVSGGLAAIAKWIQNAHSVYFIEAQAKIQGVALHPFDQKNIVFQ